MQEFLHGAIVFVMYVVPAAGGMFLAGRFLKIPDELFRKFCILFYWVPTSPSFLLLKPGGNRCSLRPPLRFARCLHWLAEFRLFRLL